MVETKLINQIKGVAMGTKMGPSYACLFMGHFEHLVAESYSGPIPEFYRRYIDDGLGITKLSMAQLNNFFDFIQNFRPSIKFTSCISESRVEFLDIEIFLRNHKLSTSVFYKKTATHAYVHFSSSHPPSCKEGVPYSEFLRLRRLCSEDSDFHDQCQKMAQFFLDREYPRNVIETALNKAAAIPRSLALKQKESSREKLKRPIFPLTYHPHTVPIRHIIRANWHTLAKSKDLKDVFEQPPLFAYKRDRNLKDMLVHAALRGTPSPPGTFPCEKQNCKSCPFLTPSTVLNGPNGSFNIKYSFNCQNNNVVYALVCSSCSKIYIGETYRRFEVRIGEHLADITHKRMNRPVAAHFCQEDHSISDLQALCVWQNKGDDFMRKTKESELIALLGSLTPGGINIHC